MYSTRASPVDDKDGAGQEAQFFNQGAISLAESGLTMIGQGFEFFHPGGTAPAFLGKGKVHANDQDLDFRAPAWRPRR